MLVWAIWFVAARTFSMVAILGRVVFTKDGAAWFGPAQRTWTAVQTLLTTVAPFGSALHFGHDWTPPVPGAAFWFLALVLPLLFLCAFRWLSGRHGFRDGLGPGLIAAAWVCLSIVFDVGVGVLGGLRGAPGVVDPAWVTGRVIGMLLVATPYLALWVVLGSSVLSAAIMSRLGGASTIPSAASNESI